jgi:hypothetical protein
MSQLSQVCAFAEIYVDRQYLGLSGQYSTQSDILGGGGGGMVRPPIPTPIII